LYEKHWESFQVWSAVIRINTYGILDYAIQSKTLNHILTSRIQIFVVLKALTHKIPYYSSNLSCHGPFKTFLSKQWHRIQRWCSILV